VTVDKTPGVCDLCGRPASVTVEPPRRTLARGTDPDDSSLSVIVVLPDVLLCEDHAEAVVHGEVSLGWCDDEKCRGFGEVGLDSACGDPYRTLKR
jgi:hypothetical protein